MNRRFSVLIVCSVFVFCSSSLRADEWSYQFEPYLMISSIKGDAAIGRVQGAPVDVDMSDILEVLDTGFMAHFEAQHESGWGLILDYGFMDLKEDITGPRGGIAGVRVRQGVLEALVTRNREINNGQLEVFGGVRWWDNDFDLRVDLAVLPGTPATSINVDWVDLVVGTRWTKTLSEDWKYYLRADVGGFGIQADFTSTLAIGFRHTISDLLDLNLQYRATWVDYDEGQPGQPGFFSYDTVSHGPIIGLTFKF